MRKQTHFARDAAAFAFALAAFAHTNDAAACYGCFTGHSYKVSPGLACVVDVGSKKADWGYFGAGGICNYDSAEDVLVHCPLMREEVGDEGLSCASATLIYKNTDPSAGRNDAPGCGLVEKKNYECRIKSKDATGYWGWSFGVNNGYMPPENAGGTLSDMGLNVWATDWRAALPQGQAYEVGINHLEHGSYWLSCWLPSVQNCRGRTCVSSVKWVERGEGK